MVLVLDAVVVVLVLDAVVVVLVEEAVVVVPPPPTENENELHVSPAPPSHNSKPASISWRYLNASGLLDLDLASLMKSIMLALCEFLPV